MSDIQTMMQEGYTVAALVGAGLAGFFAGAVFVSVLVVAGS